jgi:hypothetical protein
VELALETIKALISKLEHLTGPCHKSRHGRQNSAGLYRAFFGFAQSLVVEPRFTENALAYRFAAVYESQSEFTSLEIALSWLSLGERNGFARQRLDPTQA